MHGSEQNLDATISPEFSIASRQCFSPFSSWFNDSQTLGTLRHSPTALSQGRPSKRGDEGQCHITDQGRSPDMKAPCRRLACFPHRVRFDLQVSSAARNVMKRDRYAMTASSGQPSAFGQLSSTMQRIGASAGAQYL